MNKRFATSSVCVCVCAWIAVGVMQAQTPAAPAPPLSCDPAGQIRFVCDQDGPEDLVAVPRTAFIVASAYGATGGIHLIDTKQGASTRLYPSARATETLDRKAYAMCPGPPQGDDREHFRTHGLYLKAGPQSTHTLYAVHHGARETIEIFELHVGGAAPSIVWIGCVVAPDPIGLNAVIALPDGGFAATNFDPRPAAGVRQTGFSPALMNGENNGEVWEWHTASGWAKVPGSESAGANGLELSPDGRWYYVAQWGNRTFMRLSRGRTPVERQSIPLGFRVDNVRWAPDGRTLLVAGQGDAAPGAASAGATGGGNPAISIIGRIDPQTMTYRQMISQPTTPQLNAATVAVQIGNELWAGSFRGDRVARYPLSMAK